MDVMKDQWKRLSLTIDAAHTRTQTKLLPLTVPHIGKTLALTAAGIQYTVPQHAVTVIVVDLRIVPRLCVLSTSFDA